MLDVIESMSVYRGEESSNGSQLWELLQAGNSASSRVKKNSKKDKTILYIEVSEAIRNKNDMLSDAK